MLTVPHVNFFLLDVSWFSDYIYINYYVWKCAQTMSTVSHTVNDSLHHVYSFFLTFHTFLAIFAWITILGNAHRPCKHYPNIVNNSICHVYSFFLNFPNFLAILELITIFRNAHRPCNQCPNIITNSEHHPYFFPILLLFFVWKYKTYHIW